MSQERIVAMLVWVGLPALVSLLVAAGLAALRRARPWRTSETSGTIRPDRWSACFAIAVGVAFMTIGLLPVVTGARTTAAALVVNLVFGATMAGFMAPSLTSVHAVRWDEIGIEGPCSLFGLTLGTRRTRMRWAEIARTGKTATGYWYVESRDGRRDYWSFLYTGYAALVKVLRKHRADLTLIDDLP
jgi:hypothetical protein